ncbi:hypothetical protein BDV26DRAFT_85309 [Aspergillus bertholletiae]|uniref:Uncharacterized protein n=1 Tax=Aspergillus bertholletiae TaxID=1226010 RepID=A0A5N7BI57_9EURO|nr:hypothetical protein BDV26DRAFT_85309 [Aspergillus bertholletiae]
MPWMVSVRWIYNCSVDPLEANFQIGQEGNDNIPPATLKLNISSSVFASEYVTDLLGPSAFVWVCNANWADYTRVNQLAKVSGFTLTTMATIVPMTSPRPHTTFITTTARPKIITGTSITSPRSTSKQPEATVTPTAIPGPLLPESDEELSDSAKAGIGAGASVGALMIIAAHYTRSEANGSRV